MKREHVSFFSFLFPRILVCSSGCVCIIFLVSSFWVSIGAEDGYRAVDDDSNFDEHYDNGSFDDDEEDVERPEQKRRKVKPSPQQSFRSTSPGTRKRSKMPSRRGRS